MALRITKQNNKTVFFDTTENIELIRFNSINIQDFYNPESTKVRFKSVDFGFRINELGENNDGYQLEDLVNESNGAFADMDAVKEYLSSRLGFSSASSTPPTPPTDDALNAITLTTFDPNLNVGNAVTTLGAFANANDASILGVGIVSSKTSLELTFVTSGLVTLTDTQWTDINDDGESLQPGQYYYVSGVNDGQITKVKPTVSGYDNPIGFASTTTQFMVVSWRPSQVVNTPSVPGLVPGTPITADTTFSDIHFGKTIALRNTGDITLTMPVFATEPPLLTFITLGRSATSGNVTNAVDSGVIPNSLNDNLVFAGPGAYVTWIHQGGNDWDIVGALKSSI